MPASPTTPDFSGLWIPLVTPFLPVEGSLRIDHTALARLAQRMRAEGARGLVACGTTGEAAALDAGEQRAVLDTVLAAVPGMPVVMGLSGYHLGQAEEDAAALAALPLAGVLVAAPHYIRPSQPGLLQWFTRIADASTHPLVIYDIPYRTGATLQRDTLLQLAEHPRIAAIKDCGGDAGKTLALITQGRLQVLAGEDLQIFATVAQGGAGAIAASAHVATARFAHVIALLRTGELEAARRQWLPLVPLIEALFAEPNPAPLKALLSQQEQMGLGLRAPMAACSPALQQHLARLRAGL